MVLDPLILLTALPNHDPEDLERNNRF